MKYSILFILIFSLSQPLIAQNTVDNTLLLDYYQSQRYMDAYNYLKSVYPEPVTDIKALSNLAYTSQMAKKLNDAEGYYLRIYAQDSSKVATLFSLGSINVSRGNSVKAIAYYKKILLRDSTNFNVYKQLANLSQNIMDTVTYSTYLQKANAINPEEPDVAFDLGQLYIIYKKYDKAAIVLDKAIQADTANLFLLKGKAQVKYLQKKYPETITACTKLIEAGDKQAAIINWLAISYYKTRQYKQCVSTFQLLSDAMQNEGIFFYQAMSYKALNDQPNAIVYFLKALKDAISPNVADYYTDLGDSYDSLHQLKKAIAAYQKSMQFAENPLTYYSLANLYDVELKDKKVALKYYKKYLASNPSARREQKYIDYAKMRIPALGSK
jgi:tetratricopeptide (TPR) repeat protein